MDAIETLGTILGPDAKRDAVHVAVLPVVAAHGLRPGDEVGLNENGKASAVASPSLGIVDPFLKAVVKAGEQFWLFLYPRTITSLRHVWTHPDVPEEGAVAAAVATAVTKEAAANVAKSKEYLTRFALSIGETYDALIEHMGEYAGTGHCWFGGERFEGVDYSEEIWDHYENVTGEVVSSDDRGYFFSCAC